MGRMYSTALSLFSPLLAWYDRNPVRRAHNYAVINQAPAGQVTRWTYTVPTGKKTWMESCYSYVRRNTAATTVGVTLSMVVLTVGGVNVTLNRASFTNNTVGAEEKAQLSNFGILLEGDVIVGVTGDFSTGGTMDLEIDAKITEFSA